LNDPRDFGLDAAARSRAAQRLDRTRELDLNRDRMPNPGGSVRRGLDIGPPPGQVNPNRSVDTRRGSDLSDRLRYDRDTTSGLPTGARRSTGFRGLDRANEQLDQNRARFDQRTGRVNRGLDNAFDRTMENRQRFDDRLDNRFESELDERMDDRFEDRLPIPRGSVNRR
jgi:hypothetical protein